MTSTTIWMLLNLILTKQGFKMTNKLRKLVKKHNKEINKKPKPIKLSLYSSYDDSTPDLEQYRVLSHQLAHEEQTLSAYRM